MKALIIAAALAASVYGAAIPITGSGSQARDPAEGIFTFQMSFSGVSDDGVSIGLSVNGSQGSPFSGSTLGRGLVGALQ